jgi:PIN like domain
VPRPLVDYCPSPLVFFIDYALGKRIAVPLSTLSGARIELHRSHFAQDEEDVIWLPQVAARGWVLFTKDKMIRKRPEERALLLSAGLRSFILVNGQLNGEQMAQAFIAAMPRIRKLLAEQPPPFVARVERTERVTLA